MHLLKEKILPRQISREEISALKKAHGIRRIPDYFSSLLYAAEQMELSAEEKKDLGIIYVSHLGPVGQVHKYVEDLLTYPPDQCSPAFFSHSVFNAPAAFLTKHLNIRGSSLCVCGFQQIIEASVLTAYAWLNTAYCPRVLVIYSDEEVEISTKISELTGLKTFQKNHLLLLEKGKEENRTKDFLPGQLITKIKQQHYYGEE